MWRAEYRRICGHILKELKESIDWRGVSIIKSITKLQGSRTLLSSPSICIISIEKPLIITNM